MYEYIPKRNNKKAAVTTLVFSAVAAIGFFSSGLFGSLAAVVELVALAAVVVAILVAGRYLLKDYVYSLEETETGADLTVTEVQGKRRIAVCRIGTEELEEILVEGPETKERVKERLKSVKRYDYCVDLAPVRSLHLLFTDRDRAVAVRLVPDERMETLLMRLSPLKRANSETNSHES